MILKFCGGGQSVPASISSGPELLVEFTTSPYGTFITTQTLHGFQLEVSIIEYLVSMLILKIFALVDDFFMELEIEVLL